MRHSFDYTSLIGRIRSQGTMETFAKKLHISPQALHNKLINVSEFKQSEIKNATEILGIKSNELDKYFFTINVGKCPISENAKAN